MNREEHGTGPPQRGCPDTEAGATDDLSEIGSHSTATGQHPLTAALHRRRAAVTSQQVSWWSVQEYVAAQLEDAGSWPTAGSPAWFALPDGEQRKLAALLDAAQHWALRVETCQRAQCEASRAVSAAADWSKIGRQAYQRRGVYIPRVTS